MILKRFKYFYPEKPVLVHREQELVYRMSENPDFVGEIKFNGIRLVLHVIDGKPEFWGRHGDILTYKPCEAVLSAIREKIPCEGYYIFDGELRLLKSLNLDTSLDSTLILIEQCEGNFKETFERLITESDEFEGIVMKNLKGTLNLGRTGAKNSQWMFKIRRTTGRHRY